MTPAEGSPEAVAGSSTVQRSPGRSQGLRHFLCQTGSQSGSGSVGYMAGHRHLQCGGTIAQVSCGQARQPQLCSHSCTKGRAAPKPSSSFFLKSSLRLARVSQHCLLPCTAGLECVVGWTITGKLLLCLPCNSDLKICSFDHCLTK